MTSRNLWQVDVALDGDHWETLWILAATAASAEHKARRFVVSKRNRDEWPRGRTTFPKIKHEGTIDVF